MAGSSVHGELYATALSAGRDKPVPYGPALRAEQAPPVRFKRFIKELSTALSTGDLPQDVVLTISDTCPPVVHATCTDPLRLLLTDTSKNIPSKTCCKAL